MYLFKILSIRTTTICDKYICAWSSILLSTIYWEIIPSMSQKCIIKVEMEKNLGSPKDIPEEREETTK